MKSFIRAAFVTIAVVLVGGLVGLVVLLGTGVLGPFMNAAPVVASTETRSSQVINAVTGEEQVVLLSLGIQGIEETSAKSTLFGVDIPGSERIAYMRYEFTAKLGLEGKDVEIAETAEDEFVVSIPPFTFIGHEFVNDDGEPFKMVVDSGGAFKWVTPEIDSTEMINRILSDGARAEYIDLNRTLLQDQSRAFYTGIINAISPTAVVAFEYR